MSKVQIPNNVSRYRYQDIRSANIPYFQDSKYRVCSVCSSHITSELNQDDILIIDTSIDTLMGSGLYLFEYDGVLLVREIEHTTKGYTTIGYKECDEDQDYDITNVKILGIAVANFRYLAPSIDELLTPIRATNVQ